MTGLVDGSAPLVWGTLESEAEKMADKRFSPTGVGNVIFSENARYKSAVQPHWCGERRNGLATRISCGGSAPLVWGTCHTGFGTGFKLRFSPTGVGNV